MIPQTTRSAMAMMAALATLGLTACASSATAIPKACDGHHRRPGNPYGSVLSNGGAPPLPPPPPPAAAAAPIPPAGGCR